MTGCGWMWTGMSHRPGGSYLVIINVPQSLCNVCTLWPQL